MKCFALISFLRLGPVVSCLQRVNYPGFWVDLSKVTASTRVTARWVSLASSILGMPVSSCLNPVVLNFLVKLSSLPFSSVGVVYK